MVFGMFGRPQRGATAAALYAAIVAQSRRPEFYTEYGVADTIDGRFDLIVLHQTLLLRRLTREGYLHTLAQEIFDTFCRDMDGNLREMGVGDLAVPKRMLKFGEAFYGRFNAYDQALAAGDREMLAAALARNLFGDTGQAGSAPIRRVTAYVEACEAALSAADPAAIVAGTVPFADPATIATPALTGA
ncbi:ubiquinol-cytochrome C chaperone family protein [Xanthobacteraceae bacterium Astr-EGSB]|nr:ubiquinol-cytochrome C chaperone family protein [Xanthobacteraceae bacterium Astr-EGSB]